MESTVHTSRLVEEPCIVLHFERGRLRSLAKCDSFRNITILFTPLLILLACHLKSLVTLNLPLPLIHHLHSLLAQLGLRGCLALNSLSLGAELSALLSSLCCKLSQLHLPRLFFSYPPLLLHVIPDLDLLSSLTFRQVQVFVERREPVVHSNVLQVSAISCQTLVKRDGVALCVLPIRDAWWNLPILLVLGRKFPRRRVHHRWGRRRRTSRDLLVLELWRFQRVLLPLCYAHHTFLAIWRVAWRIYVRRVPHELRRLVFSLLRKPCLDRTIQLQL
mmetsp:Transcript_39799/g.91788  ORF Transcript_39799/g.91788 Transcript_39799/m.91788 type:complete len:275 (-) Transcript_39799:320-1144(-)